MIMAPRNLEPGIYAIVDGGDIHTLFDLALSLLKEPISALQIRARSLSTEERRSLAQRVHAAQKKLSSSTQPLLIINDDAELAKVLELGLHVGQDDLAPQAARRWIGQKHLLGVSTHNFEQALAAQKAGADYIGFGPIYKTETKDVGYSPRGTRALQEIIEKVSVPVVAIGGIHAGNIAEVIAAGAKHIAVISALHDAEFRRELPRYTTLLRQD